MIRPARHIASAVLLFIAACGGDRAPRRDPSPPVVHRSTVDTSLHPEDFGDGAVRETLSCDLDGDGIAERVLVTLDTSGTHPADAIGDRVIVVARRNGTGDWAVVAIDTSRWTISVESRDVTGDRLPDLVLERSAGGNDPIASNGMAIISADGSYDRRIRTILSLRHGNPTLVNGADTGAAVAIHARLWPPLVPRTESFEYVDDILRFRQGIFRSDPVAREERFARLVRISLREYRTVRPLVRADTIRFDDSGAADWSAASRISALFPPAARILLYSLRCGDARGSEAFWSRERDYLRDRMPRAQFELLDSMRQRVMAGDDPLTEGME